MKIDAHSCENESDELLMLRMALIGLNFIPDEIQGILNLSDDKLYGIKKQVVSLIGEKQGIKIC